MSEAEPQSELSAAAKTPPFVSPTTVRLINQMRERLECRICMDLMRSEIASLPCQHCFCKMCIETWLAQQKRCPVCNTPAGRRGAHKNAAMEQLVSVFGGLSASIAQEKTKVEVKEYTEYEELYPMLLWPALFLLALDVLLRTTWLRTLP